MKSFIAISVAVMGFLSNSFAYADSWKGKDKDQHMIAGAVIGSAVTLYTEDAFNGCAAASAVGLAKEVYDSQHRQSHTPSFKDFAVTAIAGCLAAKGTSLLIVPKHNGLQISYNWTF